MSSTKELRRRIQGIKSTGKITRAMEMISAVKMRKAMQQVLSIRPYAESALAVLGQLKQALSEEREHPLIAERPARNATHSVAGGPITRQLYVVMTSHRGLCGSFNAQVIRRLKQVLIEDQSRTASFIALGRKGETAIRRLGGDLVATFPEAVTFPTSENIRPVARLILDEFQAGRTDRVVMVYTDFVSVMRQEVKVRGLLPVAEKDARKALNDMEHGAWSMEQKTKNKELAVVKTLADKQEENVSEAQAQYVIEPSPAVVLEKMIPRLIEVELLHALLESNASQEAARMLAMRNATDAAKDMTDGFTLLYNQIRQAKVTQEIAELSAGMAAVEG